MQYAINHGAVEIDEEDYDKVNRFSWSLDPQGYAITSFWNPKLKKLESIRMHVLVKGRRNGKVLDHINRIKTDNRKSNLRHVTLKQNWLNSPRGDYFYALGRLNGSSKLYERYGLPNKPVSVA